MLKKTKVVALLSASALGLMVASCNNSGVTENSSEVSSIVAASRILHDPLPDTEVGIAINLDEYITVQYRDNSRSHNFEVTSASQKVTIDGHFISASEPGVYSLTITAGTLITRLDFNVVTEEQLALSEFLAPLTITPKNYRISLGESTTEYLFSYVHTENYVAIYSEDDPLNSPYGNTVLAKLSDGHAYWGGIVDDGNGNPKASFRPGYASYDNYYITMDMSLEASSFSYQTVDGAQKLVSDTTFEQNLLNYGASQFPERNDYSYAGAIYLGLKDTDQDGVKDTAFFDCQVSSSSGTGTYAVLGLSHIGNANVAWMDTAVTDSSYVPAVIHAPEITTAFAALDQGRNYTVTTEFFSADEDGNEVVPANAKDAAYMIFGSNHIKITQTFTDAGVIAICQEQTTSFDSSGKATVSDFALTSEYAVWDDDTATYRATYDSGTQAMKEATKVQSATGTDYQNVYDSGALNSISARAVTSAAVDSTVWTKKTTNEDGTVTYQGQCGTNDGADEVTDALFQQLYDMNGILAVGTNYSSAQDFTSGKAALISQSNYDEFTVNPTTNEVTIKVNAYMPFSDVDNHYVAMNITINAVGTTTNDFSSFAIAA